jgi:ABC-2 type transport system permease protein
LPGGDFSAAPVVGLSVVAAALLAAGAAGFRRRDIG